MRALAFAIVVFTVAPSLSASIRFIDEIAKFDVTAVDEDGAAFGWSRRTTGYSLGRCASFLLARAPTGTPAIVSLELAPNPQLGALPGLPTWEAVAIIPCNALGFRDARVAPGRHLYQLLMLRHDFGDAPVKEGTRVPLVTHDVSVPVAVEVLAPPPRPENVEARPPINDDGTHLEVGWQTVDEPALDYMVLRADGATSSDPPTWDRKAQGWPADWKVVAEGATPPLVDTVEGDGPFRYAVAAVRRTSTGAIGAVAVSALTSASPVADWFDETAWVTLAVILLMAFGLWFYIPRVRKDPGAVFIRRIAGVDAIEDSIGRATEMGRPVLYVTGVENIQNIQTIASLLCLGPVAEMTAEYDTELKVANFEALTMVVAEEIVRQGYANAGRADAHRPENCMFISSEQFAFAAGVNGMIVRDRPATNIYLGRFFAESLMLAETGYITKSVQIAGTAEVTQLPFFIAACDYTIIGEELYAVSAYLSKDPRLLATLKATDLVKFVVVVAIIVGSLGASLGLFELFGGGAG